MLRIIRHAHRELASDTVTARKEFHSLPFYSAVSCTRARACAERGVTVRVRRELFLCVVLVLRVMQVCLSST